MAVPWLKIVDAVLGITDVARKMGRRSTGIVPSAPDDPTLAAAAASGGPLEARLAGVVVAALKEAFDRDHQRMQFERDQLDAERERADRALRLELLRQAGDREIGRLRLLGALAVAAWLGTLVFSTRLMDAGVAGRAALGAGWLLLLAAIGASFTAQSHVARSLIRVDPAAPLNGAPPSGIGGALAPWLIVAGLAAIALGILLS